MTLMLCLAYFSVGLFAARTIGHRRYRALEPRVGEYRPGGEDSHGYCTTSVWQYPSIYTYPLFSGVLWPVLLGLLTVGVVGYFGAQFTGRLFMRFVFPPICWFFAMPEKRST